MTTKKNSTPKKSFQLFCLAMLALVSNPFTAEAQCNCKFTITAGQGYVYFDGAAKGVKGGDVICVNAGNIQTIQFVNIRGSAGNPVIIKNCGGQSVIGGPSANNGMLFTGSKYVRITGSGDAGYPYGFKIQQTSSGSQGIAYTGLSSDLEIDHVEIAKAGYAAIMAKTDPSNVCSDVSAVRPNFSLTNILIHDNYIHDSQGEGIYLGDSFYLGTNVFCGAMQYCHDVKGVRIYNNKFENTGRESIQVGAATTDVEIYGNTIYNYGALNMPEQNGGVQLGLGTAARFYNNFMKGGTGPALAIQGIGSDYVYNNVFVNPGSQAITINTRPTPLSTDIVNKGYLGGVYVINNTFVNAAQGAVIEFVNSAPGNVLYNNLIVGGSATWDRTYAYTDWKRSNNVAIPLIANAKFANAGADDYHLLTGSPAIDAGRDVSTWGVTFDYERKARPSGSANDLGAFEFSSSTNKAPTANAGADKTITLPTSSLALTGSGADTDGTIASYAWTKQSGGNATLTNATTATLSLSGLVSGTYVFRLTVKDNGNLTAYDDVTVVVKPANAAPTVNAGADQTITLPTIIATLSGSATDADGTISSYAWSKQSGPTVTLGGLTSNVLNLSGLIAGTFVFRLTATDNLGATGYDDITVTVNPSSVLTKAPVANAGVDKTITLPTNSLTLTGSATDEDGTVTGYAWTKQSGGAATLTNASTATVSLTGLAAGTYVFRLTATDNSSLTGYDETTVIVKPANTAPTVNSGSDRVITLPTSTVTINATASDADGTISNYAWTKQTGAAATLAAGGTTLTASGLLAGTYVFRLTVTDNNALTAYDDVTVTVNPAAVGGSVLYRINAGGPTNISASPMNWVSDSQNAKSIYLDGGSSNYTCGAVAWSGTNTTGAPNDVFGPNRYSPNYNDGTPMQWNFPVSSGTYEVRLFFAETPYAGGVKTAGARVFSVKAEGSTVISNFDIYATAGMNATKKVFTVSVTDGTLDLDFIRGTGNPQVNGIEILTSSGSGSRTDGSAETAATEEAENVKNTEPVHESVMDVYPNPFQYQFNLSFDSEQKQIAVVLHNMDGRALYKQMFYDASSFTIDMTSVNLPQGVYILVVTTDRGKIQRKIVKE